MRANPRGLIRPDHNKKTGNISRVLDRFYDLINGSISIGGMLDDNTTPIKGHLDNMHVNVISPVAPNTEFTVTHNLGRLPTGVRASQNSNGGVVYNGVTAWTTTQVFLKCTTGSCGLVLEIY